MSTWIALLYSVNVGKNNRIAMADLRDVASDLGFESVRSVIATGNLLFESRMKSTAKITDLLESGIEKRWGRRIDSIVRPARDWQKLLDANPFAAESKTDPSHVTVRVMREPAKKAALEKLLPYCKGDERVVLAGGDVWAYFPHGIAESKLATAMTPQRVGGVGTVRNWNTLQKIAAKI